MASDTLFTPKGTPLNAEQLAEYTSTGEVTIRRSDVERAIATASGELKLYLGAGQYRKK